MKGDGSWKVPEFSVEFKVNVNESGDLHSVSIRPQFYEGDSSLKEDLGTHVNKIKVSLTNRKNRIEKFTMGRSRLGQNFHGVTGLFNSGMNAVSEDSKQRTALHFAASQGNEYIVKLLLDRGANPNAKDIIGNTPLHLATLAGHVPVITLLIGAGSDMKSVDMFGRTPLQVAQSRLKILSTSHDRSFSQLKTEVNQITDMLKVYLKMSTVCTTINADELCSLLERTTTREDVVGVSELLDGFATMNLGKDPNQASLM